MTRPDKAAIGAHVTLEQLRDALRSKGVPEEYMRHVIRRHVRESQTVIEDILCLLVEGQ